MEDHVWANSHISAQERPQNQADGYALYILNGLDWMSKWKWNAIAVENHSATECLMLEWTFSPTPLTEQHNYSTWPGLSPDKFWIYRLHNISGKPVLVLVTKDDKNSKGWKYCCLWVMPDFCTRKKNKKKPNSWTRYSQRTWTAVISYKSHCSLVFKVFNIGKAIWVNMETALQMLKCGITILRHDMLLRLYHKYRTSLIILSWGTRYDLLMPLAI